jgi:HemY protein
VSRLFFLSLIALVAGAGIALYLAEDPGYVQVSIRGWTLEATLGTVVLSLLLGFVLLSGLIWLIRTFNPLKLFLRSTWRSLFSARKPAEESTKGLQLLLQGRWQEAYKLLVENAESVDTPIFNYLGGALAAYERGDKLGWNFCIDKAEKLSGVNNYGVKSLRGFLETRDGKVEQGLAMLLALYRIAPQSPFVLRQIKDIYVSLPDWDSLGPLLPELEKQKVVSVSELEVLTERVMLHRLVVASQKGLEQLKQAWQELPKALRFNEELTGMYLEKLLIFGQDSEASNVLTRYLRQAWSDRLVSLLGYMKSTNPQQHLLMLEDCLQERPNNTVLLLTLGRLSLRNQLWGKGREYFEHALRSSKSVALTAEISAELGRLLEYLGEHERSLVCYQQAMQLMENKLPELPLPPPQR